MISRLSSNSESKNFNNVFIGAWTNWSQGVVFGYTLTLERSDANLLIAFLALFVTIVGTRTWRIACFAIHRILSSEKVQDALYHQHQAILRNSSNANSGLFTLIQLLWTWRSTKTYRRIIPIVTFTGILAIAFAVASGFSSRVATGNEVLVSSPSCGPLNTPSYYGNFTLFQTTSKPYLGKKVQNAANYVQQCYNQDASGDLECGTFVKKNLPITTTTNASCPFGGGICRSNDRNLILDTGYMDSHEDFGLNSSPKQRFQFRSVLHCSPLITNGYKTTWNLSSDRSYTKYHYGRSLDGNFTYQYGNDAIWESKKTNTFGVDYNIAALSARYRKGSFDSKQSAFQPIPNLRRPDADVHLFFLSAGAITFITKTIDNWYSATNEVGQLRPMLSGGGVPFSVYAQDEVASPMACTYQQQWCNPNLPDDERCTPLSGRSDAFTNAEALFQDSALMEPFHWFWDIDCGMDGVVTYLGSQALTSKNTISDGMQGPLPDNQWHLDVQHWFATNLAYMQASAVAPATGPSDIRYQQYVTKPNTTAEKLLCMSQKIISTAHISFSLFGIYFILVLGCLIILISYFLEPFFNMLHKRNRLKKYAILEWCANETLQLQRLAHEELGFGTWSHATDAIPVTKYGEPLAVLDLEDPKHPRLKSQIKEGEKESESTITVVAVNTESSVSEKPGKSRKMSGSQGSGESCTESTLAMPLDNVSVKSWMSNDESCQGSSGIGAKPASSTPSDDVSVRSWMSQDANHHGFSAPNLCTEAVNGE